METDSQKPKKWMGIANEPNYRFASNRMCVYCLLFKGPHFASPYPAPFCFTLHYHKKKKSFSTSTHSRIIVQFNYISTTFGHLKFTSDLLH
jgi:hypothetical protein